MYREIKFPNFLGSFILIERERKTLHKSNTLICKSVKRNNVKNNENESTPTK